MKTKSIQKEDIIILNFNVSNNIVNIFVTELKEILCLKGKGLLLRVG